MRETKGDSEAGRPLRLLQLDLLRGVAILMVVAFHFPWTWQKAGLFKPVDGFMHRFGWTGVDLFFVLSGYLVGGLLLRELRTRGRLDIRRFLIRRLFKIWPSYYVFLAYVFATLFMQHHGSLGSTLSVMWPSLLHIQNYYGTPRAHTWSLAVEEHFYLALPLFLFLLPAIRKGEKQITALPAVPIAALALMLFGTSLRFYDFLFVHADAWRTTLWRADGLAFGVLLAYLYHFLPDFFARLTRHSLPLAITGIALLAPIACKWDRFHAAFGFTSLYLGYGCLLTAMLSPAVESGRIGRILASRPARLLASIGYFSYPIYLWHGDMPALPFHWIVALESWTGLSDSANWLLAFTIYMVSAVLGGVAMGMLIEKPALALRERLFPASRRAVIVPQREEQSREKALVPCPYRLP